MYKEWLSESPMLPATLQKVCLCQRELAGLHLLHQYSQSLFPEAPEPTCLWWLNGRRQIKIYTKRKWERAETCFVHSHKQQRMNDRELMSIRDIKSTCGLWEKSIMHNLLKRTCEESQKTVAMLLAIWNLPKGNKCSKYIQAILEGKPQWAGTHRASLNLLWSCMQWTDKAASRWIGFTLVRAGLLLNIQCSPFTFEALCWGTVSVSDSSVGVYLLCISLLCLA